MSAILETQNEIEKVIVVGVSLFDEDDTEKSLDELEELITTAGAVTVGRIIQNREQIHNTTYVGKGKIDEIKDLIFETEATGIVCDDELSPVQLKNLENELNTKVMDRTLVILDIFAKHAATSEGKIQVELAQLKYNLGRLVGIRSSLSRLGGGIGTRGPGEKKLEMDRRLIKDRIAKLNKELKEVRMHREVTRSKRNKNNMVTVAIVGYTNAGKSTLLNTLTDSEVLEEDKLFATLDPTTRILDLPQGQKVLLTDTVGFIRKLPHHLVEAFRSTLEEAKYADIIIHVVDATREDYDKQMYVVYETLDKLGVKDKHIITAFNKQDLVVNEDRPKDMKAEYNLYISAKKAIGVEDLKSALEEIIRRNKILLERVFPYDEASKIQLIRNKGELLEEEYRAEGIYIKAYVPAEYYPELIK